MVACTEPANRRQASKSQVQPCTLMRPRRRHSNLEPLTSNLCLFIRFRTLLPQQTTSNPFVINHFRTLYHATEGGGGIGHPLVPSPCLSNDFHAPTTPRSHHPTWCPASVPRFLRHACGDSSIFHGSRNTVHGPRPSSSLERSTANGQLSILLPSLSFQRLATIKFSNPLVLKTIRNAGGVGSPQSVHAPFKKHVNSLQMRSASTSPTLVPRIGRSPVRGFLSVLSTVSCRLSAAIRLGILRLFLDLQLLNFRLFNCRPASPSHFHHPLCFQCLAHSFTPRLQRNSFGINSFRTLSIAMGVCTPLVYPERIRGVTLLCARRFLEL
jgi:hypothetical protein